MFLLCFLQNYRYLDLLNVLCVCDSVAIPDNQTYITEHWLRRDRVSMMSMAENHLDNFKMEKTREIKLKKSCKIPKNCLST